MHAHTLFVYVYAQSVCAISLGVGDLELRFANKYAMSLPGDGKTEYSELSIQIMNVYECNGKNIFMR